jgi:hypothetical protein
VGGAVKKYSGMCIVDTLLVGGWGEVEVVWERRVKMREEKKVKVGRRESEFLIESKLIQYNNKKYCLG